MRKIWEAMGTAAVTMFALYLLYQLLKPYVLFIALAVVVSLVGQRLYRHARQT